MSLLASPAFGDAAVPRPARIDRYLLFNGFDIWRGGFSAHGGGIWSPHGFTQSGFALKIMATGGVYRYRTFGVPVVGVHVGNSFMPGWLFKLGRVEIAAFAGLDMQQHRLLPDDPGNRRRGNSTGLRAGADLWFEPAPGRMMTAASLWLSTIGGSYWTRAALGWRVWKLWLGPEVQAQGDDSYRQWRAGLHATALRFGKFEWNAGAGYLFEGEEPPALYGRLGIVWRR